MKIEKRIALVAIIIFIIVSFTILLKENDDYKKEKDLLSPVFKSITVLDKKIPITNKKIYRIKTSCSELKEKNKEFIYYDFNENKENQNISVKTIFYNEKGKPTTKLNDMNNMKIIISAVDNLNSYEQLYEVDVECE